MEISSRSAISFLSHSSCRLLSCWLRWLMASFTEGKSLRIKNCFRSDTSFIRDSPARTLQQREKSRIRTRLWSGSRISQAAPSAQALDKNLHNTWGFWQSSDTAFPSHPKHSLGSSPWECYKDPKMNPTAPGGCAAHRSARPSATHNICSSDMHLVVILFTLGCSRDLSFILDLKKESTQIDLCTFKIQTDNYYKV